MDAIQVLLLSVLLFGAGGLVSLLLNGFPRAARAISGLTGILASLVGLVAAIQAVIRNPTPWNLFSPLPFGQFTVQMDGLSTLMVGMICLLGLAVSLYSNSYLGQFTKSNTGMLGFFTNIFIAMMLLVVTVDNAFYFLVFWEMMTLASYFLVTFESGKKEVVQAGYLYMLIAHAGGTLIMLSFLIVFLTAGSFDFAAFRQAELSPLLRDLVFLLAFIGFGAKAGMVPLHFWMPPAYSAAPSTAAALMASVMKKTAIYGILRICVDLLGGSVLWWGLLVLLFGALSAILGVLFALAERDMKRILAYSSIENVGIILMGIGVGMIGAATRQPTVELIGFLAALYHALNHSFFKGLLFLGAGSVDYSVHTRNLNDMGGLGRLMPWTSLMFLVGGMSVAAIPPFNGFVSEWFTYQAFFTGSSGQDFIVRASLPLCAALLALVGTLSAMVTVKMYGSAFTGPARSEAAGKANEVPYSMLTGMAILGIGCVLLGLGAPFISPYLVSVVSSTFHIPSIIVANETWVYPGSIAQGVLSTPLMAVLLLGLLVVPWVLVAIYADRKAGIRKIDDPWACGYGYSSRMSVTARNFDQPVSVTFNVIYAFRSAFQKPMRTIGSWAKRARDVISNAEPVIENIIKGPITRSVNYAGQRIQSIQMGDIRMYCLYIVLTLTILLIATFR